MGDLLGQHALVASVDLVGGKMVWVVCLWFFFVGGGRENYRDIFEFSLITLLSYANII